MEETSDAAQITLYLQKRHQKESLHGRQAFRFDRLDNGLDYDRVTTNRDNDRARNPYLPNRSAINPGPTRPTIDVAQRMAR